MVLKTTIFDPSQFLDDDQSQAELMAEASGSDDPGYVAHVLGVIARARGMTSIAKDAGVSREALYQALCDDSYPNPAALLDVVKALGAKHDGPPSVVTEQRRAG